MLFRSKHVPYDSFIVTPCVPSSISLHAHKPLQEGCLSNVVGNHKGDNSCLELSRAEENLKKSLELDVSQEEMDFFNGNLSSEDIKKLVMQLSILKRNLEERGQELRDKMCDLTLLDVLAKKLHKLLSKLQAHGRARKPKEKKATRMKSGKKHKAKTQIFQEAKLEARAHASHDDFKTTMPQVKSGRITLIQGHNKKYFKENFKPP